ncbi:uncharacterized protein [Arachis hypogaea]|uniref:uncharacterized protein n=1 Tax=Arachis hypogaea TaxID=3818 RepID=UPI003B222D3B
MSFGLKNAGATYQRLMDKVFRHQIGQNMEIYVDDMVAKTPPPGRFHCEDLREIFKQIRAYNMRLNLEKCAFGVQGGKFLEFILTSREIETNPEKCDAILNMASPKIMKEVQQLAGRVAALSRFLPMEKYKSQYTSSAESCNQRNKASKNQAEYKALIAGLKLALNLQVHSLTVHCDSLMVVQQIRGEFQVKDPLLERYWLIAKDLISKFDTFIILHVHREKNIRADILSKLAATRADTQTSTLSQLTLKKPRIELLSITSINHLHDWRTPFLEYINAGIIPRNELNPQHFRRKASLYTNIAGELYKCGFSQPLLKCLNDDEAKEVMNEIYEGVYGNHIGGRALVAKIIRTGYYWPTMKRDCITKVKTYDNYQKHAAISMKPAEVLHIMEAEAANRVILQAIKKKLNNAKGEWVELIPEILRSYNTTIQSTTGETPFKQVYGSEALIPIEVSIPTLRTELYDEQHNINVRNAELDLIEEDRDIAAIK